jgi:hypothetical protein
MLHRHSKIQNGGVLPDFVTKEHIESNIQDVIDEAVGDVALSSEYYDMNDDIEWEIYLEGKVKIQSKEFSIDICEDPFCEHCGERHTDFGIEVRDDGTAWCIDCFLSGSDADDVLSKEELSDLYKREKKLKIEHYKEKLKQLGDE